MPEIGDPRVPLLLQRRFTLGRGPVHFPSREDEAEPSLLLARQFELQKGPVFFPDEEKMPESPLHVELKFLLFALLKARLTPRMFVGCDHFVYWEPSEPTSCLAPDVFVKRGGPPPLSLRSYKIWEHGSPEMGVEIISRGGSRWTTLEDKLERYRRAGIAEIVFFDADGHEPLLRIWDWMEGDVRERDLSVPAGRRSRVVDGYWVVANDIELGPALRVADDPDGHALWPTPAETERAAAEAERATAEAEHAAAERERVAKERALARVAELEAELARRR